MKMENKTTKTAKDKKPYKPTPKEIAELKNVSLENRISALTRMISHNDDFINALKKENRKLIISNNVLLGTMLVISLASLLTGFVSLLFYINTLIEQVRYLWVVAFPIGIVSAVVSVAVIIKD